MTLHGSYNHGMDEPVAVTTTRAGRVFQTSLLILVTVGLLTVASTGRLDVFPIGIFTTALLFRILISAGVVRVSFPRGLASFLAVAYLAYYCYDIFAGGVQSLQRLIPATVQMLFFFTALKLVIANRGRDYFYLGILAFLHMLLASMFIGSVMYLGLLFLFIVVAILTYTSFEILKNCESSARVAEDFGALSSRHLGRRLTVLAGVLGLAVLILSAGLFVIFPRTLGISSLPGLRGDFRLGFADEIDLGATGTLALDDSPVMHVESMNGAGLEGLRWRGVGLSRFNGVRWSAPVGGEVPLSPDLAALQGERRRAPKGRDVEYAVTMQPLCVKALFLTGLTETIHLSPRISQDVRVNITDSFLIDSNDLQPLRYGAKGWVSDRDSFKPAPVVELFSEKFKRTYLQLPAIDTRIPGLAQQITGPHHLPLDKAKAVERFLLNQYAYILELPKERADDPLAHFLFERREGHCEYFASAMAVMLRSQGIPSRIAAGFYGGVYNPLTGRQVIRGSDAHSWVEAYIDRYGWLTFDPTPPVPGLAGRWLSYWLVLDAIESSWTNWVIDYDVNRQLALAKVVQTKTRNAAWDLISFSAAVAEFFEGIERRMKGLPVSPGNVPWVLMAMALATVILLWLSWVWLRPRLILWYHARRLRVGRGVMSDCSYLYAKALDVLRRQGFRREAWETAEEFAQSIDSAMLRRRWEEITVSYNAARFGADVKAAQRLPKLVAALQQSR